MEQIKSLKYLDCVASEGLRLYPPIPSTTRVAMKDDIIPLSDGTGIRYVDNVASAFLDLHQVTDWSSIRTAGLFIPTFTVKK